MATAAHSETTTQHDHTHTSLSLNGAVESFGTGAADLAAAPNGGLSFGTGINSGAIASSSRSEANGYSHSHAHGQEHLPSHGYGHGNGGRYSGMSYDTTPAYPPKPSFAALPVDRTKTEPKPAYYKLQFGDDVTGFSYYVRTLSVLIGRNCVSFRLA